VRAFLNRALPLYAVFFLWSFGTGAQQFARPQFAAELGAPVFFVSLIAASNSFAWLIAGPLTGVLSDRWGRKPLVIAGNALRGITTLAQYFSTDYLSFFALEFIGGIGVSMWVTGASIVMADITSHENRGTAVAIRSLSAKLGAVTGPLAGAFITSAINLRSVFIFNAVTKVAIHLVLALMVSETRPQEAAQPRQAAGAAPAPAPAGPSRRRLLWPLAIATLVLSAIGFQGVLGALLPLHVVQEAGFEPSVVGQLMSLAATSALIASLVTGPVLDRWGRKPSLVLSMLLAAVAVVALGPAEHMVMLSAVALAYGVGEGVATSAADVYTMDMAPATRRGAFLGNWSLIRNIGGAAAPVAIGAVAQAGGTATGFMVIGALLVVGAVVMQVWGPEPLALARQAKRST